MPDDFQPGPHLSPDQLSAFAENALPAHERLTALAHMADCADCRRVVFLIQQGDPALAAAPVLETPRRSWFTLPQIFGAATAALACSLILALIIHAHHQEPQPIATAQNQPQTISVPPPPSSSPSTSTGTQSKATGPKSAKISSASTRPRMPIPAKVVPQPLPPNIAIAQLRRGVSAGTFTGHFTESKQKDFTANADNGNLAQPTLQKTPSAAIDGPVRELPSVGRTYTASGAEVVPTQPLPAMSAAAPAPPAPPSPSSAMDSSSRTFSGASLPIISNASNNNMREAAPASQLPSKLTTASVLNSAGRTLALDTAGNLFLSLDHGAHWSAVTPLWSGKVVRITLTSAPTHLYQVQPAQTQAPQQQQAPIPTAIFELTTAAGVLWLSDDGLTWHAR